MLDVHECIGVLSKQLQKQSLVFSEIQPHMDGTIGQLNHLESHDGKSLTAMKACIQVKESEDGKEAFLDDEKLLRYEEKTDSDFAALRLEYLGKLQKNIQHRFRKEDSEVFRDLSLLLEPAVVTEATTQDCENALEAIGLLYGQNAETKITYGNLQEEGLREEVKEVPKLLDREKLSGEWPRLKAMVCASYKNLSLQNLCKRVITLHQDLTAFATLFKIALCFSVTSIECERSFSVHNRIKNKYRGSIKSEKLDTLISIAMSKVELTSFNPNKAIRLWLAKTKRRKSRLCQEYKARAKRDSSACSSSNQ